MKYSFLYNLVFFIGMLGFAQQNSMNTTAEENKTKYNFLSAGAYIASPVGNSAYADSKATIGFEIQSSILIKEKYYFGIGYNQFNLNDHNIALTGNNDRSRVSSIYAQIGYCFLRNKWELIPVYSIGQSTYRHEINNSPETFSDKGFYNNLGMKINYELDDNMFLKLYAGYRIDFLNVDSPPQISEQFDSVHYFNATLGVNFRL